MNFIDKNNNNKFIYEYKARKYGKEKILHIKLNPKYESKKNEQLDIDKYNIIKENIQYVEKYVIYIIINDALKMKELFKIGMTRNLIHRLSTYNTSCQHEVLYFSKSCKDTETMSLIDKMIKKRLAHCRIQNNREFFIGDLWYLIKNIDECINFILGDAVFSDSDSE
jgi:hypothetical protein